MTHITKTLHIHLPILILFYISTTQANEFLIVNRCQETIWAAATPGGGKELPTDATWTINVAPGTTAARIWGRTGCTQTGPNGLKCQTGDCGGLFQCTAYGSPPNTLAEYTLNGYQNQDFIDISLVQGYNVPMRFMANSNSCNKVITCSGRVKGECPSQLRVPNGCNDACTALNRPEYCCPDGVPCNPTQFSRYFKDKCPQAYSYPKDDQTSLFTCPPGTNYKVVFCPRL